MERIKGVRIGSAGGTGENQYTKLEPNKSDEPNYTQEDLAKELERIKCIQHGATNFVGANNQYDKTPNNSESITDIAKTCCDRKSNPNNSDLIYTQEDLAKELERIKGIHNGGDRKSEGNNCTLITREELANELERIKGIHQGNGSNQHEQKPNNSDIAYTQEDLAKELVKEIIALTIALLKCQHGNLKLLNTLALF